MSSIFNRFRRGSSTPDKNADDSARLDRETRRRAENDARGQASEVTARSQAAENETRRQASEVEARRQAAENEERRLASEAEARRQGAKNEARHLAGDGAPDDGHTA